jgi:pilus assembly protein CpaF
MLRAEIYGQSLRYFLTPVADFLYEDESVTEVLVNGPNDIYVERRGRLEKVERRFADEEALLAAVHNLAEYVQRRIDEDHHSLEARLPEPERFRVHAIIPPSSRQGVCVSIRKFHRTSASLAWLIGLGSLDHTAAEFLEAAVKMHRNVMVAGGTGAGKTSLLNALSAAIPTHERIIVIEDSSELRLEQPHTIYLEAQQPRPDGSGGVTIRDLFVDSLRMRPDRIIVGEVRRGEALDLIQSMLSGHDGALSTVHASNPLLALVRLETLCLMSDVHLPVYVARTQVASAIHLVVQTARLADGSRRVTAISEVLALDEKEKYVTQDLFRFQFERRDPAGKIVGRLRPTGKRPSFTQDFLESGLADEIRSSHAIWGINR